MRARHAVTSIALATAVGVVGVPGALGDGWGGTAYASPTPTPEATWPAPGEGANEGTPRPMATEGKTRTIQQDRKPANLIETDVEEGGKSFTLSADVLFRTGSAQLTDKAQSNIKSVADRLKQAGVSGDVQVVGHTDNTGTKSKNQTLSEDRAEAVRTTLEPLLANSGIELQAEGKGQDDPLASNSTEDGKRRNRRVAVVYEGSSASESDDSESSDTSISVGLTEPAPKAQAPLPDVRNALASVQKDLEDSNGTWTVRVDVTELRREGKFLKIGYVTRLVNTTADSSYSSFYYFALFSGDTQDRSNYNAVLLDRQGSERLSVAYDGQGSRIAERGEDDSVSTTGTRYGWAYFPMPSRDTDTLSFHIPAFGTIDDLKIQQ